MIYPFENGYIQNTPSHTHTHTHTPPPPPTHTHTPTHLHDYGVKRGPCFFAIQPRTHKSDFLRLTEDKMADFLCKIAFLHTNMTRH